LLALRLLLILCTGSYKKYNQNNALVAFDK